MALVIADRVKETSTTTGIGTYNLDGANVGFRLFVAGVGTTNTTLYCATDGTNWEVGIGTVTDAAPDTLARTTILSSSNAGAAVNWGAGTKTLFCTNPASWPSIGGLTAELTALTGANTAPGDLFGIVDISDLTMGAGGTNKKITREEFNTFNLGTITADRKLIDHSVTWNAAVTFTAWKLNVTSTLSNAASLLMDLQLGGESKIYGTKAGDLWATNSINVGDSAASHFTLKSVGYLHWAERGGGLLWYNDSNSEARHGANSLGIGTSQYSGMTVIFERDANDVLGQRRGAFAQASRLYNFFTDPSNYERGFSRWASNVLEIGTESAGTGVARALAFYTGGVRAWNMDTTGRLLGILPLAGLGYGIGAGGIVTQITSKATGVTLSKVTGEITTAADALLASTAVSFVLTNTAIAVLDHVLVDHVSGGTAGGYTTSALAAAGSATVTIRNVSLASLSEALVIKFSVLKSVTS